VIEDSTMTTSGVPSHGSDRTGGLADWRVSVEWRSAVAICRSGVVGVVDGTEEKKRIQIGREEGKCGVDLVSQSRSRAADIH
jgi:hypothetical protein